MRRVGIEHTFNPEHPLHVRLLALLRARIAHGGKPHMLGKSERALSNARAGDLVSLFNELRRPRAVNDPKWCTQFGSVRHDTMLAMALIDKPERARQLARAIASDLTLYH